MSTSSRLRVQTGLGWHKDRWSIVVLFLFFAAGIATESGSMGLIATGGVLLFIAVLLSVKFSLLDISAVLLPVMFYVSVGVRINVSLVDFLLPFMCILAVQILNERPDPQLRKLLSRLLSFLILLVLALLASLLAAGVNPSVPFELMVGLVELSKILICAVYAVVYLILGWDAAGRKDWRFLQVWTWTAVSAGVIAVLSLFVAIPGFEPYLGVRARASFEDPNLLGMYLLSSAGIVVAYNWLRFRAPVRLNLLPLVLGVVVTESRAGLIALVVGLSLFFIGYAVLYLKLDIPFLAATALAAIFSPLWWSSLSGGEASRIDSSIGEDVRFDLWATALDIWMDNLLLGVGYGQFPIIAGLLNATESGHLVHNTFLSFSVEAGLFGGLIFAGGFVSALWYVASRARCSVASFGLAIGFALTAISLLSVNGQNIRFVWVFIVYAIVTVTFSGARSID